MRLSHIATTMGQPTVDKAHRSHTLQLTLPRRHLPRRTGRNTLRVVKVGEVEVVGDVSGGQSELNLIGGAGAVDSCDRL